MTITKLEYEELLEESEFLAALRAAGVDNWVGYEFALESLSDVDDED